MFGNSTTRGTQMRRMAQRDVGVLRRMLGGVTRAAAVVALWAVPTQANAQSLIDDGTLQTVSYDSNNVPQNFTIPAGTSGACIKLASCCRRARLSRCPWRELLHRFSWQELPERARGPRSQRRRR